MKKKIIVALVLIAFVIGGVMVIKKKKAELANMPLPMKALMPVRVVEPFFGTFPAIKRYLGTIRPKTSADISPRITGRIFEVKVREGQYVKKGQLLVLVDDRQLLQKIRELEAQLSAARSNFQTQQGIYERDLRLFKAKALSKEQLDRSKAQADAARAQVATLRSALESQKVELSYARLTAPFDGVITRRYQDPGTLAVAGKPILSMEAPSSGYFVEIRIPQAEFSHMKVGQTVFLSRDDEKAASGHMKASISRIHPAVNIGTLATVEADVNQRPFDLPTGATLRADIEIKQVKGWKVPLRALLENVEASYVFTVDEKSMIRIKKVHILYKGTDWAVLEAPPLSGSKVVIAQESGLLRLHEGQKVKMLAQGEKAL